MSNAGFSMRKKNPLGGKAKGIDFLLLQKIIQLKKNFLWL